jgi:hypothetical protein
MTARRAALLLAAASAAVPTTAHADVTTLSTGTCQYVVTGRSGPSITGQLLAVFTAPYGFGADIVGTCEIRRPDGTLIHRDSRASDPDVGVWFFGRPLPIPYGPAEICTSWSWSWNPALTLDHRTGTVNEDGGCAPITS